jgi:hypothetical protein
VEIPTLVMKGFEKIGQTFEFRQKSDARKRIVIGKAKTDSNCPR